MFSKCQVGNLVCKVINSLMSRPNPLGFMHASLGCSLNSYVRSLGVAVESPLQFVC